MKRAHADVTADTPFSRLAPDDVLATLEMLGIETDGRLFALNSYENRVYQAGTGPGSSVVIKFYRPARWSDAQILEEHAFAGELAGADLAVAAPLRHDGRTLHAVGGYRVAVFPFLPGRPPELDDRAALTLLGRAIGRLHAIGGRQRFRTRAALSVERFGWEAREAVLASGHVPEGLAGRYAEVSAELLAVVEREWRGVGDVTTLRLHGDCHAGNILWNAQGPIFVDLDDCTSGPAIQDLWMLLSGPPDDQRGAWDAVVEGYEVFRPFDTLELRLIEPLRALRMIHYAAWLALRWSDPAFPRAFPWFGEPRYWERHVLDLLEQRAAVDEPPLLSVW
jgi:Ser/Thr protein kinase RdoA (MazF antagonist)